MAAERLSRLQRRILPWLLAEEQRTRGTMSTSHEDLVHALAHHKGNLSTSLRNLEAKGLVRLTKTPGGKIEAVDLTRAGRDRAEVLNKVMNKEISRVQRVWVDLDVAEIEALEKRAGRELRTVEMQIRVLMRQYVGLEGRNTCLP
jgi:DNA-binding transcriptional regulator GbsR (MarR family)